MLLMIYSILCNCDTDPCTDNFTAHTQDKKHHCLVTMSLHYNHLHALAQFLNITCVIQFISLACSDIMSSNYTILSTYFLHI